MKEICDWLDSPAADPYWIGAMVSVAVIWIVCFVWKVRAHIRNKKAVSIR